MLRIFGQFLAMFAVIASAVNAQCAISCSLQRASGAERTSAVLQSSHPGHACCSKRSSTVPDQQPRRQPCPNPVSGISDSAVVPAVQHQDAGPLFTVLPVVALSNVLLPVRRQPAIVAAGSAGIQSPPAYSILRV